MTSAKSSNATTVQTSETAMNTKNIVNLQDIASQFNASAKKLQEKIKETGKPCVIKASQLVKQCPALQPLADTAILRTVQLEKDKSFMTTTLTVYKDGNDSVNVYSPILDLLEDFTFIEYKTGYSGFAIVQHNESGLKLQVRMSLSDDHESLIKLHEVNGTDGSIEGKGNPDPSYVAVVPQPEIPLWSREVPMNEVLEIISNGSFSREHQTPLVTLKTASGEIIKNVITNARLRAIYNQHGVGAKFKISDRRQQKVKGGNSNWRVDLIDLQTATFEDFDL